MSYQTIGHALIDGPRSLFPPASIDDIGWLEPILKLTYWESPNLIWTSCSIFCDSTSNRDDKFLPSVIRYAHWNQADDQSIKPRPDWPTVKIHLSYIDEHIERVNREVYELHTMLTHLPYEPLQTVSRNETPKLEIDNSRGQFSIMVINNLQLIEFYTPILLPENALTNQFFGLFNLLQKIIKPIDRTDWRERYDHDLRSLNFWDWHGQSIPLSATQESKD